MIHFDELWCKYEQVLSNLSKLQCVFVLDVKYICPNKNCICLIWSRRSLLVVGPLASQSRNQQLETTQLRSFKGGWSPSLPHWTGLVKVGSFFLWIWGKCHHNTKLLSTCCSKYLTDIHMVFTWYMPHIMSNHLTGAIWESMRKRKIPFANLLLKDIYPF